MQNITGGIVGLFARAGLCTVKFLAAILLAAVRVIGFIASELKDLLRAVLKGISWAFREITESFRSRVQLSNELTRKIRRAKKEGKKAHMLAIAEFVGSFFFGEGGVFYTAFNYILPILSFAFLIGIIMNGTGFEYGLAVQYNGRELGFISAEADFEEAQRDVKQRICYSLEDEEVDLSAKISLRIVSEDQEMLTPGQLADRMLQASNEELTEAYGIYIDGKFIGAVRDKKEIQDALNDRLANYKVDGIVKDISYLNKIEFTEGIYLESSVREQSETIEQLTSTKEKKHVYIAQDGDTMVSVVSKYGMRVDEFLELNPDIDKMYRGKILTVIERESFLPIKYVREMETLDFLDYESVEVETSDLNVGATAVLVKGERGEKVSDIEITYVDGIESSRQVLSSEITRNPVMEIIGIGTYTAMPDYPDTVYNGGPLTGTGQFGWPLAGGWISDVFISDRNHKGLDVAAPEGTEIYAAADGIVVSAGWNYGGYGNVVMIDHLDGYATVYAHMIFVYAEEGQYVAKGQLIGFVGTTGNSTGNHLHFEVRYQGVCLDPTAFLNTEDAAEAKRRGEL